MSNKRVNIIMDEKIWRRVHTQAKRTQQSASAIVRDAIENRWLSTVKNAKRQQAHRKILFSRQRSSTTIDYKGLINEGRKV